MSAILNIKILLYVFKGLNIQRHGKKICKASAKYYFEVLGEKVPRKARKSLNAKYAKFKGY